jgi:hypothetical protein
MLNSQEVLYFPEAETVAIGLKLSCLFILIVLHHNLLFMKLIFRMFSGMKIKFRISAQIGCGPD